MAGKKQHYLAAAYLAGFSATPTTPRRESPIWVGRRGVEKPYQQRCDAVGYKKDLYTLRSSEFLSGSEDEQNLTLVDETWEWVEQNIGQGIELLRASCHAPLPARLWLSVLVPFCAQVFVRGADWIPRFGARFSWMEGHDHDLLEQAQSADNANLARLMELQRLNAAILAARWQVLHCPLGCNLIVNDLGRVPMVHSAGAQGYTIPLSRRTALALVRSKRGCRVLWDEDRKAWFVDGIEHFDLTSEDVHGLNMALRDSALVECFGSEPSLVGLDAASTPRDPTRDPFLEPHLLVPSPKWLRARETDWARLLTIVSGPPQSEDEEGPWTVYAEVMPEEDNARRELHEDIVGVGAEWDAGGEKRKGLLRRLGAKLGR